MIGLESTPQLSPAARVRLDRVTGQLMLLQPERGLVLNDTAAAIVTLCNGKHRVRELVDHLLRTHGGERAAVERDVLAFVRELERRRLLVERSPGTAP